MDTIYETIDWQGFVQQIVHFVSHGYFYYHVVTLPETKRHKWNSIDQKLVEKYNINRSRFARSRAKAKGKANFVYFRYEGIGVILHTPGTMEQTPDDKFYDIRQAALTVKVSDLIWLEVYTFLQPGKEPNKTSRKARRLGASVRLSAKTVEGFRCLFTDIVKARNKVRILYEWNKINGIPAWAKIVYQKQALARFVVAQAKRNQVDISIKELRIVTKRKIVKVFKQETNEAAP